MWQQSICFSGYIQETKWNGNETLLQYSHNFKTFNSLINVSKARCCWWCGGDPNLTVERRWEEWRGCEEDWTGGERGRGCPAHHNISPPTTTQLEHQTKMQKSYRWKLRGNISLLFQVERDVLFLISVSTLLDVKIFSPCGARW